MTVTKKWLRNIRRKKFTILLVYQLLFVLTYPFIEGSFLEWCAHVFSSFFYLTILSLCYQTPRVLRLILGVAVLVALVYAIDYLYYFSPYAGSLSTGIFDWCYGLFFSLFFLLVTGLLCYHMLTDPERQIDTLAGTAGVFLMIGLAWTFLYLQLQVVQPGSFMMMDGETAIKYIDWLYFSMSRLVSSGYGDISPVSSFAKCLTLLESVIGMLFLAIITARIVGVQFSDMSLDDE